MKVGILPANSINRRMKPMKDSKDAFFILCILSGLQYPTHSFSVLHWFCPWSYAPAPLTGLWIFESHSNRPSSSLSSDGARTIKVFAAYTSDRCSPCTKKSLQNHFLVDKALTCGAGGVDSLRSRQASVSSSLCITVPSADLRLGHCTAAVMLYLHLNNQDSVHSYWYWCLINANSNILLCAMLKMSLGFFFLICIKSIFVWWEN